MADVIKPFDYHAFARVSRRVLAVPAFGAWARGRYPELARAIEHNYPGAFDPARAAVDFAQTRPLSGLGQDESPIAPVSTEPSTDWGARIADVLKSIASGYQAHEIFRLNLKRAEQGLPPIEAGDVAPQVNVGLGTDTRKLVIYGLVGIGALFVFNSLMKRRR